jgi:hypothetical protein
MREVGRWETERVLALAPDTASVAAAHRLAAGGSWAGDGAAGDLVWGACAGSGKKPYQIMVDLDVPAYRCSCPSRKVPCKHALGLLLRWSDGTVAEVGEPAGPAAAWRHEREAREATVRPVGERDGTVRDAAGAARRVAQREARVAAGLAELDVWLRDQVRTGLTGVAGGYGHTARIAARMVDAQAPGVAGTLRRLGVVPASGDGWPGRLLAEYGQLHLLVRAHERLGALPAPLVAAVRSRVGYPVAKEDVLGSAGVRDRWLVVGTRDNLDGAVAARRIWLRGERTGRDALLLLFEPDGMFARVPGGDLGTGSGLDADLHFYPGAPPLRALVGERHGEPASGGEPAAGDIPALLAVVAAGLAADPWLTEWPFALSGVPVPAGEGWLLADAAGRTLPLLPAGDAAWTLAAVSGGVPVTVAGEWTPGGLIPLTTWHRGQAVQL